MIMVLLLASSFEPSISTEGNMLQEDGISMQEDAAPLQNESKRSQDDTTTG